MDIGKTFKYSDSLVVVLAATDGTFVDVNLAFEHVTGWSREETIGKQPLELGLWPDFELRARIWGDLRSCSRVSAVPIVIRLRDGEMREGLLSAEMFEDDGRLVVLGFVQRLRPLDQAEPPDDNRGSYRALFESAFEGLYRSLPGGDFIDANPAMAHILGFDSPAAMLSNTGMRARDIYVDQDHAGRLYAELMARDSIEHLRSQIRRRDGSTIWISENVRVVRDNEGRVRFFEGSVIDITAQRAAETALRQSETLYRALVDNLADGVFLFQHGLVLFVNQAMCRMLGRALEDIIGHDYLEVVAPRFRQEQIGRREQREAGSSLTFDHEIVLVRPDGTEVLAAVRSSPIMYNGAIASTGTIRDITEQRRAERQLREASLSVREMFENSPVGLFKTSLAGEVLECNTRLAQMMGYDDAVLAKRSVRHMQDVYASAGERERIIARLREVGRLENHQTEILRADGGRIWVEISVRALRDEADRIYAFDGSVQDITARRQAEQALLSSEARYRALVDNSQFGVYLNAGGEFTFVNRALARMLGYAEREMIGRGWRDFVPTTHIAQVEERQRKADAGEPLPEEFETCFLHRDGSLIYVMLSAGPIEIDGVRSSVGTVRNITLERRAESRLRFQATHDALTGLSNRFAFQQQLHLAMREAAQRFDHQYAVLFLDLDGFKLVNDGLGHSAGDRLLVTIAERIGGTLGGEAVVARYGGDEFTVLPRGACDRARAEDLARRVLDLFDKPFDIGGNRVYSGASIGVVLGSLGYHSVDQVMRDADTAMYRAKALGKAGYVVFDAAMHNAARARFHLETDLRQALEREEFRVFYQPIVDMRTHRVVAAEALVRWEHPTRGLLPPAEFLGVAEESGLVAEIDWWVLEQACARVLEWQRRYPGHSDLRINVNVDERQLSALDFADELSLVLERSGIRPDRVWLEITETVFRFGSARSVALLSSLSERGVGLVVDDFGTGYSSLELFAASPFDGLKIDRAFVSDVETNRRHRAIVRTVARFAEDLGLNLTAEGVENQAQANMLCELGCRTAQGFLYAAPLAETEFAAMLAGSTLGAERLVI